MKAVKAKKIEKTYRLMPTPPAFEDNKNRNLGSEVLLKLSTRLCLLSVCTDPVRAHKMNIISRLVDS